MNTKCAQTKESMKQAPKRHMFFSFDGVVWVFPFFYCSFRGKGGICCFGITYVPADFIYIYIYILIRVGIIVISYELSKGVLFLSILASQKITNLQYHEILIKFV